MINSYIQNAAKKDFKEWTYEGLSFLLHQEQFREMAITALSNESSHQQHQRNPLFIEALKDFKNYFGDYTQ